MVPCILYALSWTTQLFITDHAHCIGIPSEMLHARHMQLHIIT